MLNASGSRLYAGATGNWQPPALPLWLTAYRPRTPHPAILPFWSVVKLLIWESRLWLRLLSHPLVSARLKYWIKRQQKCMAGDNEWKWKRSLVVVAALSKIFLRYRQRRPVLNTGSTW